MAGLLTTTLRAVIITLCERLDMAALCVCMTSLSLFIASALMELELIPKLKDKGAFCLLMRIGLGLSLVQRLKITSPAGR